MEEDNKTSNKENNEKDSEEKRFTKSEWIGMVIGFGIAIFIFQLGQFGFIPGFIIAYGSYWIITKITELMLEGNEESDSKKDHLKSEWDEEESKKKKKENEQEQEQEQGEKEKEEEYKESKGGKWVSSEEVKGYWLIFIGVIIGLFTMTSASQIKYIKASHPISAIIGGALWYLGVPLMLSGIYVLIKRPKKENGLYCFSKAFLMIIAFFAIIMHLGVIENPLLSDQKISFNKHNQVTEETKSISSSRVEISGFKRYSGEEEDYHFSVLFPSEPKLNTLDMEEANIRNYQSHKIIDAEKGKIIQYNVFFDIPKGKKIISREAKKAYLKNSPDSKNSALGGSFLSQQLTTFKEFMAINFALENNMHGISFTHRTTAFVFDGIPVHLSVVYPSFMSKSDVHYQEYINSFSLSK